MTLFVLKYFSLMGVDHVFLQLLFAHMTDDIMIYIYFENGQQRDHGHGNKRYVMILLLPSGSDIKLL